VTTAETNIVALDGAVSDLEAAVVVGANSVDLTSPSTTGIVGFSDSTGTRQLYMTEQFGGTIIVNSTLQPRGNVQVFDDSYSPIRLVFGVTNSTATATFNDPVTNSAYVTLTGGTKTLRVHSDATLDCDGAATFASTVSSAFASSIRQGTSTVSTSTGGTSYTYGGFTYKEFVYAIGFGYTFASAPRVHVTTSSASPSIVRVSATDVTTTGFNLRILDANDPSTSVSTEWLAIL
jgi:hypothetical protein